MSLKALSLFILFKIVYTSVLTDVLRNKNIQHSSIFTCGGLNKNILQSKEMFKHGIILKVMNNKTQYGRPYFKTASILNGSCENWTSILHDMYPVSKYKIPESWFVITGNLTETINQLSKCPIEVDTDFNVLYKVKDNYEMYEFFNSGFFTKGHVHVRGTGFWNDGILSMLHVKRMNMSGVVLKCMVVVTQPIEKETFEEYLDRSPQSADDSLHKLKYITLLKYLRDMYQFSYKMYRTNSWGYMYNGSFDGMAGALQKREVDLGGSPLFIRGDRATFLDYTTQTWESRPCFIFRHPKRVGAFYTIFTRPLEDSVWLCTSSVMLLSIVSLYITLRFKFTALEDDVDTSWSMVVLSVLGAICQQGTYVNRNTISYRILLYIIFTFSVFLYQFYNASIVSSLLMEPPKNIRSLEDLLKSPLKAGVENVLYNLDYFKRTTDVIAQELYKTKIVSDDHRNILSPLEGMALVKKGGYAFHVDSRSGYKIIRETFVEREICELQEVQLYPPQKMIAVVRKGLPHKELMTYGLRKMWESGLMHRLKVLWDEPKPECMNTPDTSVFSVSLRDFAMALLVLAFGVATSLIMLCGEMTMHKLKNKKLTTLPFKH